MGLHYFRYGNLPAARLRDAAVVLSSGVFDLFHYGHLHYLTRASKIMPLHVVAVNSDKSVHQIRGRLPYINEQERAGILDALECVDDVILFDETDPSKLIEWLRPKVFVKGEEYRLQDIPERPVLKSYGGSFSTVSSYPQRTSQIVERIKGT